jgi:adenylate cyclase
MTEARVERRLAAILAADVAGYSRLMGINEEGTLATLKAHRRELLDPKIAEHRQAGAGLSSEIGRGFFTTAVAINTSRQTVYRGVALPKHERRS